MCATLVAHIVRNLVHQPFDADGGRVAIGHPVYAP
jgi:hypothetical protein